MIPNRDLSFDELAAFHRRAAAVHTAAAALQVRAIRFWMQHGDVDRAAQAFRRASAARRLESHSRAQAEEFTVDPHR
jgi:predicted CoA-binding protein